MAKIRIIKARKIPDSRGKPTIEVELTADSGKFLASVPSGASIGKFEAKAKEAKTAVKNINEVICPRIVGKKATSQKQIDDFLIKLDGTKNKSRLGANAILAVSMVVCRAGAAAKNLPLYKYISACRDPISVRFVKLPMAAFNIINGGAHAGNDLDFQEFMVVPQISPYSKDLRAGSEIYQALKEILKKNFGKSAINIGDEGGFAPMIKDPEQALDLIQEAVKKAGYQNRVKIIIDAAASEFYKNNNYQMSIGTFTQKELIDYYLKIAEKYPIIGVEDPFAEDDFEGWRKLKVKSEKLKVLIVGDDLLATNPKRMKMAKEKNLCGAAIIKPNQIGTISEAIEAARLAKSFGWKIMVSHRSGETMDDFIADLAVGLGADFIKAGAPSKPERMVKYNRLLKIEGELCQN